MVESGDTRLGIAEVDRDHAELYRLIQRLDAAIRTQPGVAVEAEALEALVAYVDRHFGTESRLMREAGYPADLTRDHEAEHARLMARVTRWRRARQGADPARRLTFDIAAFLNAWVHHHIEGLDVRLADFLKAQGESSRGG